MWYNNYHSFTYSTDRKKPNWKRLTECVDRTRSVAVPHMFSLPFCICLLSVLYGNHSISVPYLFHIRYLSVRFPPCQCSIGKSVLVTLSEEQGFWAENPFNRMLLKELATLGWNFCLACTCMNKNNKLAFMWWKHEWTTQEEDYNVTSRQVTESIFPKWYKATGSLRLPEEKK